VLHLPPNSAVYDALAYREKLAAEERVRAYVRTVDGKQVQVAEYTREGEVSNEDARVLRQDARVLRQAADLKLWEKWKRDGQRRGDLLPLLHSFTPMIKSKMSPYIGRLKYVPDAAIKAEFQMKFVQALQSFDPSKGSLGTYVYRYMDKAKRFITDKQNIGRIPENRIYKIRQFQTMEEELKDKLGKDPADELMADELGWSVADVKRMRSELRNDLVSQGFEVDPYTIIPSKTEEVLRLFRWELSGHERDVYEYLTGYGKKQETSTGKIAEILGIPDYQVSRHKIAIKNKLQRFL